MMGFEPTTFCMASGVLDSSLTADESVWLSEIVPFCACSPLGSGSRYLRSVRWSLGTGSALVPKRRCRVAAHDTLRSHRRHCGLGDGPATAVFSHSLAIRLRAPSRI